MIQKIKVADLPDFDMAEHLDSDEAIAQYLSIVLDYLMSTVGLTDWHYA